MSKETGWEFMIRNAGNILTPELLQGLVHVIEQRLTDQYRQAYHDALKQMTEYQGQFFGLEKIEPRTTPGGYLFRVANYEQEQASLDQMQELYAQELYGEARGTRRLTQDEAVRRERAHQLAFFVVEWGKLIVGYAGFMPDRDIASGHLIAQEVNLYLLPPHRKGWLAIHFIKWIEESLKSINVREIRLAGRETRNLVPLYRRLGYGNFSYTSSKEL